MAATIVFGIGLTSTLLGVTWAIFGPRVAALGLVASLGAAALAWVNRSGQSP